MLELPKHLPPPAGALEEQHMHSITVSLGIPSSTPGTHHFLALADPLRGEGGGGDGEEGGVDVASDGLAQQRLAGARRTKQEDALGRGTGALHHAERG